MDFKRVYIEKKPGFDIESKKIFSDLYENLQLEKLEKLRVFYRYDVGGISESLFLTAVKNIFSEPPVDFVHSEKDFTKIKKSANLCFGIEYLPGQYDQRSDASVQCIKIYEPSSEPVVKCAKFFLLYGRFNSKDLLKIKKYMINPVDSKEATFEMNTFSLPEIPEEIAILSNFTLMNETALKKMIEDLSLSMNLDDLKFCQKYFKESEKRDPTITEIRILDTYWSDHCRHTTFLTNIDNVTFDSGKISSEIKRGFELYLDEKEKAGRGSKSISLMDMATLGLKRLRQLGKIEDLDDSDEINACSIKVKTVVDGKEEEWLVMFKNETHNHPTEIEPFGGASTCLGGAIRDPLSGRAYVYQAMRVTGSGDPRKKIEETIPGKLPQRKITIGAAEGYSSYGNQIGLATGLVSEIYDESYCAKRMEVGAVIAAVPKKNVLREKPQTGDVIILLGGRTGRDGCGGATGSSKVHTEESLEKCGAEVQKGNPVEERKIQRFFRNPDIAGMIKRCNDFGAGGISVAIGELADGVDIFLDKVPKKYEGLDGTELAISESQERMAVVVSKENVEKFIADAGEENLEATIVADVTNCQRMRMFWKDKKIVDISREFLNSNGASRKTNIHVSEPQGICPLQKSSDINKIIGYDRAIEGLRSVATVLGFKNNLLKVLSQLNVCSQKGLTERFDSSIGSGSVLLPFGGKYQLTPSDVMVAKLPLIRGNTDTCTIMSYGYNSLISKWSPYHGAIYAVIESLSKIVAAGGDFRRIRMSFQEYFERLGTDSKKWGKPFASLLGGLKVQLEMGIASIGGKDSMSGSFKNLNVPPTLIAFSVCPSDVHNIISTEFKKERSSVYLLKLKKDENELPDFEYVKNLYNELNRLIMNRMVLSASVVRDGGAGATVCKMAFGNKLGFEFNSNLSLDDLFGLDLGSMVVEISEDKEKEFKISGCQVLNLGKVTSSAKFVFGKEEVLLEDALKLWMTPLQNIFPSREDDSLKLVSNISYFKGTFKKGRLKIARPRVFIPVFPGTNCEYDSARAFEKAGAIADIFVFRNLTSFTIEQSIKEIEKRIAKSQIIMIPGGFSAGDEPEGSGKFIATVFRNTRIKDSVMNFLENRDGLMLGICNGFQALIKLGLVPYGKIIDMNEESPTLTFNNVGRHVSAMAMTKVVSTLSPWFANCSVGDIHNIPVSHGEGRCIISEKEFISLSKKGQIATQYVDFDDNPIMSSFFNPNGADFAVEAMSSPDGRILGKMGHSERTGSYIHINVPGLKDQKIFESGVTYFY